MQIKAWDRIQLNPTCTYRISLLLHHYLNFALASDNNKNILLVVGFNYNIYAKQKQPRGYLKRVQPSKVETMGMM